MAFERFIDGLWSMRNRIASVALGKPTEVKKEVLQGARLDSGKIDPNILDGAFGAVHEALRTGKPVIVREYHAREIHRSISPKGSTENSGTTG